MFPDLQIKNYLPASVIRVLARPDIAKSLQEEEARAQHKETVKRSLERLNTVLREIEYSVSALVAQVDFYTNPQVADIGESVVAEFFKQTANCSGVAKVNVIADFFAGVHIAQVRGDEIKKAALKRLATAKKELSDFECTEAAMVKEIRDETDAQAREFEAGRQQQQRAIQDEQDLIIAEHNRQVHEYGTFRASRIASADEHEAARDERAERKGK